MNKEVKIITTLKELKSFCKKNKIKCVKDKENKEKLELTIPPYIDTMSKSFYSKTYRYETEYFLDRFVITTYDHYYDEFNDLKTVYSWNNNQNQILGVVFLKWEYVIFTKSEKIKWNDYKHFYLNEFKGESNE